MFESRPQLYIIYIAHSTFLEKRLRYVVSAQSILCPNLEGAIVFDVVPDDAKGT